MVAVEGGSPRARQERAAAGAGLGVVTVLVLALALVPVLGALLLGALLLGAGRVLGAGSTGGSCAHVKTAATTTT